MPQVKEDEPGFLEDNGGVGAAAPPVPPSIDENLGVLVDEDDIVGKGGNAGGPGDKDGPPDAIVSGLLHYSFGSGPAAVNPFVIDVGSLNALGLTSNGAPVQFAWDGTTLTGFVDNDGTPGFSPGDLKVLVLEIPNPTVAGNDHPFTLTLLEPLDHAHDSGDGPAFENDIVLQIYFTITTNAGLTTSGSFPLTINDDSPVQTEATVSATVEEDDLNNGQSVGNNEDGSVGKTVATGSLTSLVSVGADEPGTFSLNTNFAGLTSQGLTSHGVALSYSVLGDTLTAKAGALTVFTLQVQANGDYTFTLVDQLDHAAGLGENNLPINLASVVTFTDFDGDAITLSGGFTVTVQDDIPVQTEATVSATVEEDDLNNGQSVGNNEDGSVGKTVATGSLTSLVSVGADEPGTFSLNTNFAGLTSQGLTSHGVALSYSVLGDTLTAKAGALTVFTLQVQANGDYTFTLVDQLDHAAGLGENNLPINLASVVTFTDFDGDAITLSGGFTVTVQDDIPVQTEATVSATVEEDDLNNGQSVGNNEDGSVGKTVATGSLTSLVSVGADEPGTFSLNTNFAGLTSQGLTSHGVALSYSVLGDTLTAKAGALTVFTLQVQANGDYTFTLVDQLDHAAGLGENNLPINLASVVTFTDFDGDAITLSGGFTVTVQDDIPVQTEATVSATVEEDDLNNGQSVGNNEDGSVGKTVATGSLTSLVSVGADEPGTFSLNTNFAGLTSQGLTSHGVALSYSVLGDTLTAKAGALTVFTLQVQANGDYTFTLVDQLDHAAGLGENNLPINLASVVTFTDFDGDAITLSGGFTVTVQDDIPVVNQVEVLTFDDVFFSDAGEAPNS